MTDPRPYSKKELKALFTHLGRKGITEDMMERLIETLWRNKYTMRTSGFANPGGPDAVISFDNVSRKFSITPLDPEVETYVPRFAFYTWNYTADYQQRFSKEEIELPDEEGLYCIYYDTEETDRVHKLFYAKNPVELKIKDLFYSKVIVAWIYWDAVAGEALHFGDDRHGSEWNPQMQLYLHEAFGARRKSGLQFDDYIADGDGSLNDHAKFSITSGVMLHDDFELAITGAGPGLPILCAFGGLPRFVSKAGYAVYNTSGRLCFNSGLNSITECADENFVFYHIFATNEIGTTARKIISVMGTHEYTTAGDSFKALDSELDEIAAYMPQQGRCYLGSALMQTADAFANTINARLVVVMNGDTHPPVSIAEGSELYLAINAQQELSIDVAALPGGETYAYEWDIHSPDQIIGDLDEPENLAATIDGTGEIDQTITAGTYAIVALNAAGETLPVNVPEMVILVDTTSVVVTWDAVPGATGYRVYNAATGLYYELLTASWDYLTQTPATAGTLPVANTAYIYQNPFTIGNGDTVEFTGEGIDVETSVDGTLKTVLLKKQRADWNATEGPNVIINKPEIPAAQIQSDWNQTDSSRGDYIKNKPTIPTDRPEDWIEFEFRDIEAGTAADYVLDLKALVGYTIDSAVLQVDTGTLTVAIKIGTTAVTSISAVAVDTDITETDATGANTVTAGDKVILAVSTTYTGAPTLIRGKLNLTRT
jgi:hypothetical protein